MAVGLLDFRLGDEMAAHELEYVGHLDEFACLEGRFESLACDVEEYVEQDGYRVVVFEFVLWVEFL